jgi:hypothetical protein
MEACSDFEAHRIRVSGPPTSIQYISVRGWTAIRVRPSPEREKKHKTKEASAGRPMESQQVAPQTAARAVAREAIPMHPPATAPRFEPGCRRARYGPQGPGRKRRKDACSARTEAWRASRRRRDGWMETVRGRGGASTRPSGPVPFRKALSHTPSSRAASIHPPVIRNRRLTDYCKCRVHSVTSG